MGHPADAGGAAPDETRGSGWANRPHSATDVGKDPRTMFRIARTTSRRRLVAPLVVALLAAAPVAAAQAEPDTNIQKPGHVAVTQH
jgi:hypothetical protein